MTATRMQPVTTSKLLSKHMVAEGTTAFRFEKPANWRFQAGQYLDMTLRNPSKTDAEGNTRSFSVASAPGEETLMVATRMRDTAFKRELDVLPFGARVELAGPSGNLILHDDIARTAVLVAGGIGITPFRSMVAQSAMTGSLRRIFLFYSNRRPEDAPFLDELKALEKENPRYKLIAVMTEMDKSHKLWHGEAGMTAEHGMIDGALLAKYLKEAVSPIYYIAGPPPMVKALQAEIRQTGVSQADIQAEEFAGY